MLYRIFFIAFLLSFGSLFSQRVGFISSDMIRDKFPEAEAAEQRIQSVVEDWKRNLQMMQDNINNIEFELKKNRLIWTDKEIQEKQEQLKTLKMEREGLAKKRFGPNGDYDQLVKDIMRPVEEKIYAAVHRVSVDKKFDLILDQSIQPIPYANYKYDLTLVVLKELGVEVEDLEAELEEKIKKDPRNKVRESKAPPRRGRGRYDPNSPESREFDREETEKKDPRLPDKSADPRTEEPQEEEIKLGPPD
jgi:outer membrane protein